MELCTADASVYVVGESVDVSVLDIDDSCVVVCSTELVVVGTSEVSLVDVDEDSVETVVSELEVVETSVEETLIVDELEVMLLQLLVEGIGDTAWV